MSQEQNDPDFYNTKRLMDYKTVDEAVGIVKSLVSDVGESYAKHVTKPMVEEFYLNEHKRQMPLSSLKNAFSRRIKKAIDISTMEEWYGIPLGSLDNKRYNQGLETVKGQSRIFLRNDGEVKKLSHFGSKIGEMLPPDLSQVQIRVKPNNWTNRCYS